MDNPSEVTKKSRKWPYLALFYLFVFLVLLKNSFGVLDPDLGWHLLAGKEFAQTLKVPSVNYENLPLLGQGWVDHEWLLDFISYSIYSHFGYIILSLFFALTVVAVLLLQFWWAKRFFLKSFGGQALFLALQLFGLWACLPHLGVRMQEFGLLNLVLLFIIIYAYGRGGSYKILFWLPPLMLFWASAHGSFLIGLFFLAAFFFIKAAELFIHEKWRWKAIDYGSLLDWKRLKIFGLFSVISFGATFLTPYGWHLYDFLFGYRNDYYMRNIVEWLSQNYFPFFYQQLLYLAIVGAFGFLLFFEALIFSRSRGEKAKINLWEIFFLAMLSYMSFKSRRHFPLLFVVSVPVLAAFFADFLNLNFSFSGKFSARRLWDWGLKIFLAAIWLSASALQVLQMNFFADPWRAFSDSPSAAVDFLRGEKSLAEKRTFNFYGWGGYLLWNWPGKVIFIDGRLPQYELKNWTFLEEYHSFLAEGQTAAKLDEWGIDLIIWPSKDEPPPRVRWWEKEFFGIREEAFSEKNSRNAVLRRYLSGAENWEKIYEDKTSLVYLRKE